ncbi:MAG: acyltransferase [Ginsengibacter sp.]
MQLITKPLRKNNFDLLRLLLALVVIFSHSYAIVFGKVKDIEPYMRINNNTSDLGSFAVNWFFVISGFLITASFYNSSSTKEFLIKRVYRIVPAFVVAFVLSIILFGALGTIAGAHPFENIKDYFSVIGLKRNVVKLLTLQEPKGNAYLGTPLPKLLNSPLWTIQFEFICYLFVPVMGLLNVHRIKWMAVLLFAIAYTMMLSQNFGSFFPEDPNYSSRLLYNPYYLPRFFTYFLSGACFYIYRDRIPRSRLMALLALILAVIASVHGKLIHVVMPVGGAYILFYFAFHPTIVYPKFASKGDFSYGTYLFAWPIQQLLIYFFPGRFNPFTLFVFAAVITLFFAFMSWHLVEKRFLQFKKNYIQPALAARAC